MLLTQNHNLQKIVEHLEKASIRINVPSSFSFEDMFRVMQSKLKCLISYPEGFGASNWNQISKINVNEPSTKPFETYSHRISSIYHSLHIFMNLCNQKAFFSMLIVTF